MKKKFIIVLLFAINLNFIYAAEEENEEEEITETVKEEKEKVKLNYFVECGYMLGYVAKGGLEEAIRNGKLSLEPSVVGEIAISNLWNGFGISAGGEFLTLKAMDWWNKAYHEKNFLLNTYNIYLGLNYFEKELEEEKEWIGNITIGLRSILLNPPEFNDYKIPEDKISSERQQFIEDESIWGEKIEKNGIEIGFNRIVKKGEDKDFLHITVFYVDNRPGISISSRGSHSGMLSPISLWKNSSLMIYLSPLSIFGSFNFFWWYDRGWFLNYSILGFYF
jgi:hypothetical protein